MSPVLIAIDWGSSSFRGYLMSQGGEVLEEIVAKLRADNLAVAASIAALPLEVRGFGHLKDEAVKTYRTAVAKLLPQDFTVPPPSQATSRSTPRA
jgi:indolepyruvate ferredoxin oxidoreductase